MTDETRAAVKSADRVLDIFELLARRAEGMTHSEIASALDIPKGSLSQILRNVVDRGYVSTSPDDRRYRIGRKLAELAGRTAMRRDIVALAEDALQRVTRRTRESSALNLLRGGQAEVVAAVSSPQRLVSHMRLGDLAPLYATSGGKVMLAHLPAEDLASYLAGVALEMWTHKTVSSVDALGREIDEIRRRGTAYSFEEYTPGIVGIARPVLGRAGVLLGSVNVAMPSVRYTSEADRTAVEALTLAKDDLERGLAG